MGVYITLEIMPDDISSEEWARVYLESLELLNNYPGEMMGLVWEKIGSIDEMPVYSRTLEHEKEKPENRHWEVVGDFASKETGESFILYYDLHHYTKRRNPKPSSEDILLHIRNDNVKPIHVFNDKTQGLPYHIPILAVATLIESRFPRYALVGGNINLSQAEKARTWAQTVLKREIDLPIRVQGKALYQRLTRYYHGEDLLKAFNDLFLGASQEKYAVMIESGDKSVVKQWFLQKLKAYKSPRQIGTIGLFIHWLNATEDLETLCKMACLDEDSPKFDPVEFADGLADTWVTIERSAFDFLDILDPGDRETPFTQFGQFILDAGLEGRAIRCHISHDEVMQVLSKLFPEHRDRMEQTIRSTEESIKKNLAEMQEAAGQPLQRAEKKEAEEDSIDDLIRFDPRQSLSEPQRFALKAFAYGLREFKKNVLQLGKKVTDVYEGSAGQLQERLTRACYGRKVVLTEDAWGWIRREEDKDLLRFLLTMTMIDSYEETFSTLRRAVLENRDLGQKVMELSTDEEGFSEIKDIIDQF